jgi:glutamate--cysteine ligase
VTAPPQHTLRSRTGVINDDDAGRTPPPPDPPLTEAAAEAWIPRTCFKTGPPERVGIELEFLLQDTTDPHRQTADAVHAVAETATAAGLRGAITIEPGGQIELSTPPADQLSQALAAADDDLRRLRSAATAHGLHLDGTAVDPLRPPRRILDHPRYAAMESHFKRWGFPGRTMMCSTVAIQVNLEAGRTGHEGDVERRWGLLHDLRPVLVAAFANSPIRLGRPTGWKSTRTAVWLALDPARTTGPSLRSGDPAQDWTRWALDAPLLLVRRDRGHWSAPPGATFRDWLRGGRAVVPDRDGPELRDLEYHLTTLFPPVRARGHLEVRYLDAQPGHYWQVPPAVLVALTEDDAAADRALDAVAPVHGRVVSAARSGLAEPAIHAAALGVLTAAVEALRRRPEWAAPAGVVEEYLERWTARGRCPADDLLDRPDAAGHPPVHDKPVAHAAGGAQQ